MDLICFKPFYGLQLKRVRLDHSTATQMSRYDFHLFRSLAINISTMIHPGLIVNKFKFCKKCFTYGQIYIEVPGIFNHWFS